MRFDGKVAAVTGSSEGLGQGEALVLGREGGQVVLNARRMDRLEATRAALQAVGKPPLVVAGTVADPAVVERLAGGALQKFGRDDILGKNGGGGPNLAF